MKRGEYLSKIMEKKGYNPMSLSKASGVPYTTIRSMIERDLTNASIDNVIKICKVLGVSVEVFNNLSETQNDSESTTTLPIYGQIACGTNLLADQNIEGYQSVPIDWIKGANHFFLRAKGDSMINARINDNDLLLIRKQETFNDGEIIALIVDDDAVLKRVYRTDGKLMLQSENTKYPPRFVNSDSQITIVGKLKMNFVSYD